MDSFDKGWFVLQTYSGYENKVKENLLLRAQTYNMLENIFNEFHNSLLSCFFMDGILAAMFAEFIDF